VDNGKLSWQAQRTCGAVKLFLGSAAITENPDRANDRGFSLSAYRLPYQSRRGAAAMIKIRLPLPYLYQSRRETAVMMHINRLARQKTAFSNAWGHHALIGYPYGILRRGVTPVNGCGITCRRSVSVRS
jgi:hypothetical protein